MMVNGTLSTINFTNLSGGLGDEQSLVLSDYTEAMTLLELENFERAYFDTTSFRTQIAAWVLAQRGLGKRITYTTGSELGETVVISGRKCWLIRPATYRICISWFKG